ncbi:MAG: PQQ-dependent sugar dehydrogenase [Anaerolineae bacterium]|nr:PQQ-dependent sugar dehydrogenase [Anaerolineae bacterium]
MFGLRQYRWFFFLLAAFASLAVHAQDTAPASPRGDQYQWVPVASGFNSPVFLASAGDGSGRLFVGEQDGYIFIVRDGIYDDTDPFLDVWDRLSNDVFQGGYTERGLLSMVFHPDFVENGLFFVNHTDRNGDNIIARYHVNPDDPDHADPASRVELLRIPQLFYDHNGGGMAFGPDGYLYIGVGDGGSFGDNPGVTAQDLSLLLGKVLRIDVNADTYAIPPDNPFVGVEGAKPEIWAYGLRNPWRISFDSLIGDLYIADVGQADYEEIDFQAAGSPGGANYGWFNYEGMHSYRDRDPIPDVTLPVAEYPHLIGCSVSGGYVYRGESMPELHGVYFFGDYCNGRIWSLTHTAAGRWNVQPFMQTGWTITSFGLDDQGELYAVDYKGSIYRLARAE